MVGKIVSAAGGIITGGLLAVIGYTSTSPQPGDPATPKLLYVTLFMWLGMMLFGWVTSIIAMHWYPLTTEKMVEIQEKNLERRTENRAAAEAAKK